MTVWYESSVTHREVEQKLHVAACFYNSKRNDAVLVRSADGSHFPALLQLLFTCSIPGSEPNYRCAVALIQGIDAPTGPIRRKDCALELIRLRERPRRECELIPVESILRGILVVPAYDKEGDWMLVDVLDPDLRNQVHFKIGSIPSPPSN